MGVIFPLSVPGRIVLVLIAVMLGVICWGLWFPEKFKAVVQWWMKKKEK